MEKNPLNRERESLLFLLLESTKESLKDIARQIGFRGYSAYRKKELAEALLEPLMDEERARFFFLNCLDVEIAFFEACLQEPLEIDSENAISSLYFLSRGYCFPFKKQFFVIPREIKGIYEDIINEDGFQEKRTRLQLIVYYCMAACNLYGTISVEKFIEIFNSQNEIPVDAEELEEVNRICVYREWGFVIIEGMISDFFLYQEGEDQILLGEQGEKPYYIPEREQFLRYADPEYFEETKAFRQLRRFMVKEMGLERELAQMLCEELHFGICNGYNFEELLMGFDTIEIPLPCKNQADKLIYLLNELWNGTRMLSNRGFTPNEMALFSKRKYVENDEAKKKSGSNIILFPTNRKGQQ